jgi:hypothetical protein
MIFGTNLVMLPRVFTQSVGDISGASSLIHEHGDRLNLVASSESEINSRPSP